MLDHNMEFGCLFSSAHDHFLLGKLKIYYIAIHGRDQDQRGIFK